MSVLHSSALDGHGDCQNSICTGIIVHILESGQIGSGIWLGGARFAQHGAGFVISTTEFDSRAEARCLEASRRREIGHRVSRELAYASHRFGLLNESRSAGRNGPEMRY